MKIKTKHVTALCLTAAVILTGFSIPKTMAYFTDRTEYTVLLLPYDGRGNASLTFEDGSTVSPVRPGDRPVLRVSYTNLSAAALHEMTVTVEDPFGNTRDATISDLPSGETRDISIVFPALTDEQPASASPIPETESGQEYYGYTLSTGTSVSFVDPFDGTIQSAVIPPQYSTVYAYKGGAAT